MATDAKAQGQSAGSGGGASTAPPAAGLSLSDLGIDAVFGGAGAVVKGRLSNVWQMTDKESGEVLAGCTLQIFGSTFSVRVEPGSDDHAKVKSLRPNHDWLLFRVPLRHFSNATGKGWKADGVGTLLNSGPAGSF